jgi:hypothetical protein
MHCQLGAYVTSKHIAGLTRALAIDHRLIIVRLPGRGDTPCFAQREQLRPGFTPVLTCPLSGG